MGNIEQLELIQPLFIDPSITKRYILKRFNMSGKRYYFDIDAEQVTLYPSVTSIIAKEFPMEQHLIDWMINTPNWREIRDSKADYGTAMHHLIADAITKQEFNYHFNYMYDKVKDLNLRYFDTIRFDSLAKDLAAFAKFACDVNLKPLACEIALISKDLNFAGAIDLVCELTIKDKTHTAIVDYKSNHAGKSGAGNAYQLEMYKILWEENYPELRIEKLFNWMPKDFRTEKPTYHFLNHTDSANMDVLINRVQNYHILATKPSGKMLITGRHKFGEEATTVKIIPIEEYIKLFI
jgi:hypothetical protein